MKKMRENIFLALFAFSMLFVFCANVYADCPLGPDVTEDLHGVLKIFNILAPLICIVFSILEMIKAITKGDAEGELKNVAKRFGKRMIYTLLLAFIPVLVDEVMIMAGFWDREGKCDLSVYEENGVDRKNSTTRTTAPAGDGCSGLTESQCGSNSACTYHSGACKSKCGFYDSRDCPTDSCTVSGGRCVSKNSVTTTTTASSCSTLSVSSCASGNNCQVYDGYCVKKCSVMGASECSQNSNRCYVGDGGNCYSK